MSSVLQVAVITISDRAARGIYEDRSGPAIEEILKDHFPGVTVTRELVADDRAAIRKALARNSTADYILTTGGTGLSARDITPEVTRRYCRRALPGIAEALRAVSLRETRNAMLSRGYAGIRGNTIIVNFPGSIKAVRLCTQTLLPVMEHAMKMLRGEGH